ncbi:MAG: hypothetical protein EAZ43_02395 [Betaproteobacteria bacterium]|nr:MAG: hypothetical protein EAZ43_02395 [Betaproteobacteria bacterium]
MTNFSKPTVQKFAEGDLYFWVEQDASLMLKSSTSFGDPVELNAEELRELIDLLQRALLQIE